MRDEKHGSRMFLGAGIDASNGRTEERTAQIIAEAERVVADIKEAIAAQERLFARHNVTKEQLQAYVKRIGGARLERELQEKLALLERENREQMAQALLKTQAPVMRSRRRRSMV